ncbi:MAG: hypothetical protein HUU16_00185 [Candidatus Omnitrophica bacterium]|nr:hypothetical protein [bacterium]NUN94567.1 hypothetical protein [Candidatus Omnitrophota bacterium]
MADVRISDRFNAALREMSRQSRAKLQEFAETMAELSKRPPPIGSPVLKTPDHRTGYVGGHNRDSIAVHPVGKMSFRVATESGYGAYLEFGTVKMPARPYLSTAFEDARRDFNARDWA